MNKLNITSWPSGRDKFIWNCIPDGLLGTTMPSIKRNAVTDGTKWEQARMTKVLLLILLLLLQLVMMCWWWLSMHRRFRPSASNGDDVAAWPKTSSCVFYVVVFCCSVPYFTCVMSLLFLSPSQPFTSHDHAHHSSWSVLLFFAIRRLLVEAGVSYCCCCWTTCL